MNADPTTGEVDASDFAVFLSTVRPGTAKEAGDALADLVGAVQDTGKAGVLQLTITVKPLNDDATAVQIFDQIKVKKPEHVRKPSLAYPDKHNNLSRTDPNTLPLFSDEEVRHAPSAQEPTDIKEPPK